MAKKNTANEVITVKVVGPDAKRYESTAKVGDQLIIRLGCYPKDPTAIKLETPSGEDAGYVAAQAKTADGYPLAKEIYADVKDGDIVTVSSVSPLLINVEKKAAAPAMQTSVYYLVMGGNKMQYPNRMKFTAALRKAKNMETVYEVKGDSIVFTYDGVPCGAASGETTSTSKAALDMRGIKVDEVAAVIAALGSAKSAKAEAEFIDGIIVPVKFTVESEAVATAAAPSAKNYAALMKEFEEDDAKEVQKRVDWLKSIGTAEYAIACFMDRIKGHVGIAPFEPCYIPQGSEVENAIAFSHGIGQHRGNLLLVGPAGSGKNMFIMTFANLMDLTLVDKTCSAGVDEEGMFGYLSMKGSENRPDAAVINAAFRKFMNSMAGMNIAKKEDFAKMSVEEQISYIQEATADDGVDYSVLFDAMRSDTAQIQFEPSVVTKSMEMPVLINLDEVNTLRPTVTSALHSALDKRRNVLVNGYKNVDINDDVIFTATMNEGSDYAGTSQLNLAFEDRWHVIEFEAPNDIAAILKQEVPGLSTKAIKILNDLYKKMKAVRGVEIQERSFSQRAFIYCGINIALGNDVKKAIMSTIVPKIRDVEDREAIKNMVDLMIK